MIRITCINKAGGHHENPHLAISHLGWQNPQTGETGKSTRMEIYNWINNKGGRAYVADATGHTAWVTTATSIYGNPYVRTISDGQETNNLLSLVECRS